MPAGRPMTVRGKTVRGMTVHAATARNRIGGPAAATSVTAAIDRTAARAIDRRHAASGRVPPGPAAPSATTVRADRTPRAPVIARPARGPVADTDPTMRAGRLARRARRPGRDPDSRLVSNSGRNETWAIVHRTVPSAIDRAARDHHSGPVPTCHTGNRSVARSADPACHHRTP